MYDPSIGEMDVELEIPGGDPRMARVASGYVMDTFQELNEEDIEYLNEKYYEDIVTQAMAITTLEDIGSIKLLH